MSHYNNKGMASDLSLGRPTSGGDTNNIAASAAARQHTYNLQQAREQKKFADDAESNIGGLECYVRALQCERDKLAAFRRELPICMGLLDDAIQASREKLTKAVASSRMVACQASYSNYGNPTYNIAGGVHSTQPSEVQARRYSWESACIKPEAHGSDHEQQQPSSSFKESNIMNMSTATQSNMSMFAHAPPHLAVPSQLHLVNYAHPSPSTSNMFLNKLQQKEGALLNHQESGQLEMMRQSTKLEGFRTHEFSSSHNEEDEHIMIAREVREYEGLPAAEEDVHREGGASPRVMISNMSNNNMNSPGAAGIMTSQTPRKARRCWSPELHQLFLHALHQLGGPQLATPKQIRELMHVEGLTNDEVKSHLQKFRLHTRRPAPIQVSEPAQQPHHLVLFGGIWVPTSAAESAPTAQLAASQLAAGGGHATPSGNHNPYVPFHHLINGHNPMQSLMNATSSDQLDVHAGMETASEVDVARSDQSTSQNGGFDNTLHEDEDTEIHLGSKPIASRVEITSPIAKARYQ